MPRGNAEGWSYGDMLRNEAEVNSVNEPEWVVEQTTHMKQEELDRSLEGLKRIAAKNGKVIGVEEVLGGYKVTVEHRTPEFKGNGKRKGRK